jgi:hypothetical protein
VTCKDEVRESAWRNSALLFVEMLENKGFTFTERKVELSGYCHIRNAQSLQFINLFAFRVLLVLRLKILKLLASP